jgi:hypothetical protein
MLADCGVYFRDAPSQVTRKNGDNSMNTRKSAAAHGLHNRALAECALLALFTTLTLGSNTAVAAT